MRLRPARLAALVAALLLLVAAPAAQAVDGATLERSLKRELRSAGPYSGAFARDVDTGRVLVSVRSSVRRIPASIEKLFVTATALLRYGPEEQLRTRAVSNASIDEQGVLDDDLFLVGGGDPTLSDASLAELARALRAAGLRRVEGRIVGDESLFDRLRGGPRTGYAPDSDLGGRLGALVLRRGFQRHPARYAARRLRAQLRAARISAPRAVRTGTAPDDQVTLAEVGSPTIGLLARLTNVPSDNFYADMLLKALGADFGSGGTTTAGARVVRGTLDDFGVRPRISDGSGLSRANLTSPRQVVRLLEVMEDDEVARTWRASMAVVGRDGTVATRMRNTAAAGRCRVKTGTIIAVSNLAGVCTTAGGERVAFAWLMNGVDPYGARAIQDRMTALLARYDAG